MIIPHEGKDQNYNSAHVKTRPLGPGFSFEADWTAEKSEAAGLRSRDCGQGDESAVLTVVTHARRLRRFMLLKLQSLAIQTVRCAHRTRGYSGHESLDSEWRFGETRGTGATIFCGVKSRRFANFLEYIPHHETGAVWINAFDSSHEGLLGSKSFSPDGCLT